MNSFGHRSYPSYCIAGINFLVKFEEIGVKTVISRVGACITESYSLKCKQNRMKSNTLESVASLVFVTELKKTEKNRSSIQFLFNILVRSYTKTPFIRFCGDKSLSSCISIVLLAPLYLVGQRQDWLIRLYLTCIHCIDNDNNGLTTMRVLTLDPLFTRNREWSQTGLSQIPP